MRSTTIMGLCAAFVIGGCGGPSPGERENRKEFELLLTAISLNRAKELEKDAKRIDERHADGRLSNSAYHALQGIIAKARGGEWTVAETIAYEFREKQPFFK